MLPGRTAAGALFLHDTPAHVLDDSTFPTSVILNLAAQHPGTVLYPVSYPNSGRALIHTHLEEQAQLLPAAVPQVPVRVQLRHQVVHAQGEVALRQVRQRGGGHLAVAGGNAAVVRNEGPGGPTGTDGELCRQVDRQLPANRMACRL